MKKNIIDKKQYQELCNKDKIFYNGTEGWLIKIDNKIIKVFDKRKMGNDDIEMMVNKLLILENFYNCDKYIIPDELLYYNNECVAYVRNFIEGLILSMKVHENDFNNKEYINILKRISDFLKLQHKKGIVIGDLSFQNIVIDNNNDFNFFDIDNIGIGKNRGLRAGKIPYTTSKLLDSNNQTITREDITPKFDKLSLLVEFINNEFSMNNKMYHNANDLNYYELYKRINAKKDLISAIEKVRNFNKHTLKDDIEIPYLGDVLTGDETLINHVKKL